MPSERSSERTHGSGSTPPDRRGYRAARFSSRANNASDRLRGQAKESRLGSLPRCLRHVLRGRAAPWSSVGTLCHPWSSHFAGVLRQRSLKLRFRQEGRESPRQSKPEAPAKSIAANPSLALQASIAIVFKRWWQRLYKRKTTTPNPRSPAARA